MEWIQAYMAKLSNLLAGGESSGCSTKNTPKDLLTPSCGNLQESRPWPSDCLPFRMMCWVGGNPHVEFVVYVEEMSYHTMISVE